jgi:hypothetical protein
MKPKHSLTCSLAIYGFRGAHTEAIEKMHTMLANHNNVEVHDNVSLYLLTLFEVLPLYTCYRCPKEHVQVAQTIVPHMEAHKQEDGSIKESVSTNTALEELQEVSRLTKQLQRLKI